MWINQEFLFVNGNFLNRYAVRQETQNFYRSLYFILMMLSKILIKSFANLKLRWIFELRKLFHVLSLTMLPLSTGISWLREQLEHWWIQKKGRERARSRWSTFFTSHEQLIHFSKKWKYARNYNNGNCYYQAPKFLLTLLIT